LRDAVFKLSSTPASNREATQEMQSAME